jgi:hypothetical protein
MEIFLEGMAPHFRRGAAAEGVIPSEYCRLCVYWDRTIEGVSVKKFKENLGAFVPSRN